MRKRPHIIIINPDEMRWDTMGHVGNKAAHTPALDDFATRDAVSFNHAYCQNPVCVPSRCSFLTGLYPHTRGHRTMRHLLREGKSSLFMQLKKAGYHVWLNGRNDLIAGQITRLEEQHANEIYYYDKSQAPRQVDFGTISRLMGGSKDKAPAEAVKAPTEATKAPIETAKIQTAAAKTSAMSAQAAEKHAYDHFGGVKDAKTPGMDGDWQDTYAAIERIKRPLEDDKPLCLFLGWTNPHVPYQVEQKYYDLVDENAIVPEIDPAGQRGKSRMIEKLQELSGLENKTAEEWRELRHVYLAQCAKVDDMFKAVCNALKEAGMYDDSAVFFLSDHGDFAGDYHLTEKAQNTYEDVLSRVPLLVKPPKMTDVHYKFVQHLGGNHELYDLDNDPRELENLYVTKAMDKDGIFEDDTLRRVAARMQTELLRWYQETCDVVPKKYDNRFSEERLWSSLRNFVPADMEQEIRQYIRKEQPSIPQVIRHATGMLMQRNTTNK